MAKIKHARKLRDLPPHHYAGVLEEISNPGQSDRAVGIIGASYVDLVLLEAISSRLPHRDQGVIEQLFGERGPLQPFGGRIQLGYLLGIYSTAMLKDLRSIKEIRNAFAHSAEALEFARSDVAKFADGLIYPRRIQYSGKPSTSSPRDRYIRAVELVSDLLISDMTSRAAGRSGEHLLQMKI